MWLGKARKHLQLQMVATIQIDIFIMFLEEKWDNQNLLDSSSQQCNPFFFLNQLSFFILLLNMIHGCFGIIVFLKTSFFIQYLKNNLRKTKENNVTKPNKQIKSNEQIQMVKLPSSQLQIQPSSNYMYLHCIPVCPDPGKWRFVIAKPWF